MFPRWLKSNDQERGESNTEPATNGCMSSMICESANILSRQVGTFIIKSPHIHIQCPKDAKAPKTNIQILSNIHKRVVITSNHNISDQIISFPLTSSYTTISERRFAICKKLSPKKN